MVEEYQHTELLPEASSARFVSNLNLAGSRPAREGLPLRVPFGDGQTRSGPFAALSTSVETLPSAKRSTAPEPRLPMAASVSSAQSSAYCLIAAAASPTTTLHWGFLPRIPASSAARSRSSFSPALKTVSAALGSCEAILVDSTISCGW